MSFFLFSLADTEQNISDILQTYSPEIILLEITPEHSISEKMINYILKHQSRPRLYISGTSLPLPWAIQMIRRGVSDFIDLPIRISRIEEIIYQTLVCKSKREQMLETSEKHRELQNIIGDSRKMKLLKELAYKYASNDEAILITGETGTGKGLLAETIHKMRFGEKYPFVGRNCTAIPEQLFESEIFGTRKGSFTDAMDRAGYFEQASNGTLFLDEIGEISPALQVKILNAVEEKKIHRLGGDKEIPVKIRLISATNKNLDQEVKKGNFRADLYYRLNTLTISIPPLRERKEDIAALCSFFLMKQTQKKEINMSAIEKLMTHEWPGNVRELSAVIKRAQILSEERPVITEEEICF